MDGELRRLCEAGQALGETLEEIADLSGNQSTEDWNQVAQAAARVLVAAHALSRISPRTRRGDGVDEPPRGRTPQHS